MKPITSVLAAAGLLLSIPTEANQDLARKNGCLACHQVDRKLVGPSFQDIAKKYAADKGAAKTLAAKVRSGGKDVWGPVPMPPNANVKSGDIDILVKWIITGAK